MKSLLRHFLVSLSLVLAAGGLGGCVAVAVGAGAAGAVAYLRGELQSSVSEDVEDVILATAKAIEQLKFSQVEARKDALSGVFEARNARNDKIVITIDRQAEGLTRLRIRVGLIGNEAVSRSILSQINKNL
jgi:hypothetical protein